MRKLDREIEELLKKKMEPLFREREELWKKMQELRKIKQLNCAHQQTFEDYTPYLWWSKVHVICRNCGLEIDSYEIP